MNTGDVKYVRDSGFVIGCINSKRYCSKTCNFYQIGCVNAPGCTSVNGVSLEFIRIDQPCYKELLRELV